MGGFEQQQPERLCRLRERRRELYAELDRYREALALIASPVPWVKLTDVRKFAQAALDADPARRERSAR